MNDKKPKYTYRVQVKLIDVRQVDITSERELSHEQVCKQAAEVAQDEYGNCDRAIAMTYEELNA